MARCERDHKWEVRLPAFAREGVDVKVSKRRERRPSRVDRVSCPHELSATASDTRVRGGMARAENENERPAANQMNRNDWTKGARDVVEVLSVCRRHGRRRPEAVGGNEANEYRWTAQKSCELIPIHQALEPFHQKIEGKNSRLPMACTPPSPVQILTRHQKARVASMVCGVA